MENRISARLADDGALERASYGSGVTMDQVYDPEDTGRLLRLVHRSGETLLSSLAYDYYPDGRVKQRLEETKQRGECSWCRAATG